MPRRCRNWPWPGSSTACPLGKPPSNLICSTSSFPEAAGLRIDADKLSDISRGFPPWRAGPGLLDFRRVGGSFRRCLGLAYYLGACQFALLVQVRRRPDPSRAGEGRWPPPPPLATSVPAVESGRFHLASSAFGERPPCSLLTLHIHRMHLFPLCRWKTFMLMLLRPSIEVIEG